MYEQMQKRVQETALKSYLEKLVAGTSGNVSEFDSETNRMVITPSSVDYRELTPKQVIVMELDGKIIENHGNLKPSSEWNMHAEIYKNNKQTRAVIHTHSPRATSFAVLHESIPIILIEMIPFLGGDIPLAAFGLPGTPEPGIEAVKVLQDRYTCLLANHGVLAVGETLDQAYIRAVYAEDAATIYHFARQLGEPHKIPQDIVDKLKGV